MRIHQPGASKFTQLSDVPSSYLGEANQHLAVNALENGLEFVLGVGGGTSVSFETVSKNLDATDATLNYSGDTLTSIVYTSGTTKTLNYTGDNLTSVVLSGSTPAGIDLTKTLTYTGADLTGVSYS